MPSESATRGHRNEGSSNLLDIRMPADRAKIASVSETIGTKLSQLDVPEDKRLEIDLAVQEALANAVVHGCKNNPTCEVRCRLERDDEGRILIIVTDQGVGFNPDHVADPKKTDRLYEDHGRGVYLIRQLMDKVQFEQGGKEIRMWKF
jgi:serine/threonine-protein kinase RsbW